ncbi:hypothetical protein [Vogesella alkaliphila]|uniref:Uncharacterized protein n=1 Tax=Vogesella alkaliphila TaxID=1193621 RepID=A0ABQ2YMK4_9NEIS|nr:hypothetical protein [Vogesella alkaliphila]GGX87812.1 hypothetical protein GCM10011290_14270 [Vogesella alkaliphila]
MQEPLLRDIATRYLLPFFSGAQLDPSSAPSTARESTVSFVNPQLIHFKVNRYDPYRLQFRRDQPFAQKGDPARETRLIEAFIDTLKSMEDALETNLKEDLLLTFPRRVVAKTVASKEETEPTVLAVIDQLLQWASRLYEGVPISSAVGITTIKDESSQLNLKDISSHDFGAVLSNGVDTLLEFDQGLRFLGHRVLQPTAKNTSFSPWKHRAIADWTLGEPERVALVLNRLGEILIFSHGQLLFAKRGGAWHFLTHEPVVRQMSIPRDPTVRRAIYETALDASFSRTGACLGVVSNGRNYTQVIDQADLLASSTSAKSVAIRKIIDQKPFQDIPRALRQELVAIDGSTVVDHKGRVLAIGAILKLPGGSKGGGRTAAAIELGKLGLGVKVSQDGGITGYSNKNGEV